MPQVRKLSADEVDQLRRRGSRVDLGPYMADISDLAVGEWGLIALAEGDRLPTIKRRYTLAATRQGKHLAYRRLRAGGLPFEVRAVGDAPAKPPRAPRAAEQGALPEPQPVRRRGRPPRA